MLWVVPPWPLVAFGLVLFLWGEGLVDAFGVKHVNRLFELINHRRLVIHHHYLNSFVQIHLA